MSTQGSQTTLYVEPGAAPHTYDANSEIHVFDSESLRRTDELIVAHGIRGTRSHAAVRVARDRYNVGGSLVLRPGQYAMQKWIPRAFGASTVANVTSLAETIAALETFGVLKRTGGADFSYTDCKVNQLILRGSSGNPLTMELEIFGRTEALITPGALPSFTHTAVNTPIIFSGGLLTIAGALREFEDFTFTLNNALARMFYNSATATELKEQDRTVSLTTVLPWDATLRAALYNLGPGGTALGQLSFVDPTGGTFTFDFGTLIAPAETPTVGGKTNVPFPINWGCYETDGSNKEVKMTFAAA